jgi:hypothetical protein
MARGSSSGKPNWQDKLKRDNLVETTKPGLSLRGWGLEKGTSKSRSILMGQQTPHPKVRYRSDYSPKLGSDKDSHGVYSIADLDQFMDDGYSNQPVVGIISYGGTTRNNASGYIRSHLTEIRRLYVSSAEADMDPALVYHLSRHYKVPVEVFTDREDLRDKLYSALRILENTPSETISMDEWLHEISSGKNPEKEWAKQAERDTYQHPLPYPHFPVNKHTSVEDSTREHPTQLRYLVGSNEALQNARKSRHEYYSLSLPDPKNEFRLHVFSTFESAIWARTGEESLQYKGWSNMTYKELMKKIADREYEPNTYLLLERRPVGESLWLEKAAVHPSTTFTQSYLHHLGSEAAFRIDEEGNPHRFSDFSNIRWEFRDPKTKEFYSLEGAMDLLSDGTWDDTLRNKLLMDKFQDDKGYKLIPEESGFLYKAREVGDSGSYMPKFIASLQEGSKGPPKMTEKEVEAFNKELLVRGFLGGKLGGTDLYLLSKSSDLAPRVELDKYKWDKDDNSLTYLPTGETKSFATLREGLESERKARQYHLNH